VKIIRDLELYKPKFNNRKTFLTKEKKKRNGSDLPFEARTLITASSPIGRHKK